MISVMAKHRRPPSRQPRPHPSLPSPEIVSALDPFFEVLDPKAAFLVDFHDGTTLTHEPPTPSDPIGSLVLRTEVTAPPQIARRPSVLELTLAEDGPWHESPRLIRESRVSSARSVRIEARLAGGPVHPVLGVDDLESIMCPHDLPAFTERAAALRMTLFELLDRLSELHLGSPH